MWHWPRPPTCQIATRSVQSYMSTGLRWLWPTDWHDRAKHAAQLKVCGEQWSEYKQFGKGSESTESFESNDFQSSQSTESTVESIRSIQPISRSRFAASTDHRIFAFQSSDAVLKSVTVACQKTRGTALKTAQRVVGAFLSSVHKGPTHNVLSAASIKLVPVGPTI